MKRCKVISGFNPDLIGKEASVVGENGGIIKIILDSRPGQTYEISVGCVQNLDEKLIDPKRFIKKVKKVENNNTFDLLKEEVKQLRNEIEKLRNEYERFSKNNENSE